jgi:predicted RNA-binding Zn ribbon-like protein
MGNSQSEPQNWICLDFVNTVKLHASQNPVEKLCSYNDFIDWLKTKDIISTYEAKNLRAEARRNTAGAQAALGKAKELREAIYHILSGLAHNMPPHNSDMAILNRFISETMPYARLTAIQNKNFSWEWKNSEDNLEYPLQVIVRSICDLLISGTIDKIGQCADERGCGYIFLDTSKNKTRRWCNMGDCGNRAKARRHYHKKLASEARNEP